MYQLHHTESVVKYILEIKVLIFVYQHFSGSIVTVTVNLTVRDFY